MRGIFGPMVAVLTVTGFLIAESVPLLAQSGSRYSPPSGSSSRTSPPAGSGQRSDQLASPALEGYCPVSVLEMRKWGKGDPALRAVYDGRTYVFADEKGKAMFEANPAKYVPALGGDCVVALVTMGKRVPGDIRYSSIHDGRLFLFANQEARQMFLADPAKYAEGDLALGGHCPVCRANMGKEVVGKPELAAFHKGLRYLFPSTQQRDEFLANPEKYVVAAARGAKPSSGSSTRQPSSGSTKREPEGSGSNSR